MKTLKNVGKRAMALVLALMMCVGMLATTAFAENVTTCPKCGENTFKLTVSTKPTCVAIGTETRTCNKCWYTHTDTIPALGHEPESGTNIWSWSNDNTHTAQCARCHIWYNESHSFSAATCSAPQTCTVCHGTKGEKDLNNHVNLEMKYNADGHWDECSCGYKTEVENHSIVDGKCACGYTETPVTPSECQHTDKIYTAVDSDHASHTWICTADGCGATGTVSGNVLSWTGTDVSTLCPGQTTTHTAQCAVCRSLVSKQVSGTGSHSFTNYVPNNDATCTKDGTETAKCDHCDATDTQTVMESATGHDFYGPLVPLNLEEHVMYCVNGCGTHSQPTAHSFDIAVGGHPNAVQATCQHGGVKVYQCKCGMEHYELAERLEHHYENGKCTMCGKVADDHVCEYNVPGDVIKDPTCNEEGMQFFSCKICHDTIIKTLAVDPDAHAYQQAVEVFPTCVDDGYETLICVHCGQIQENMPTGKPATGIHTPGEAVEENRVPARVGVAGSYDTVVYCDVCGKELSRENHTIPALPDTGTGDVVIDDTNPPLGGDPDGGDGEVELDDIDVPLAGPVTRGEFVDYLYRREGAPDTALSTFVDVPADHDYANAVGWGQANNIAWGISETEFAPDELVTVEQVKLFLSRYAAFKGSEMPELAALVGLDDQDPAMNCDEILGEFFGADE